MITSKYLNPQNDFAFKRIFGQEKNKEILISMLNAVLKNQLHHAIQDVVFLKTAQDPEIASQKQSIVDVLCKDEDGCQYIVEMQIARTEGFEKRALFYASKAYVDQAEVGEKYHNLKEVIFLAFTNHILFPKKEHYKSEHVILDKVTLAQDMKYMSFTFVELPKFGQQCPEDISKLSLEEKFYHFLYKAPAMSHADLAKLTGKDIVIKKAFDELERFSWTEEELNTYDQVQKRERDNLSALLYAKKEGKQEGLAEGMEKGMEKGKQEGLTEGMEKGMEKGKQAMVAKMRKAGVDPALIAQILHSKDDE